MGITHGGLDDEAYGYNIMTSVSQHADWIDSILFGPFATNAVPYSWLEEFGYTNNYDSASLADPDEDGFANWQEYQADTIPTNGADYLVIGMQSNQLTFVSSSNCVYEIEWCDNLSSNIWNVLTNNISGTGYVLNVADTNNAPVRFYRLNAERK